MTHSEALHTYDCAILSIFDSCIQAYTPAKPVHHAWQGPTLVLGLWIDIIDRQSLLNLQVYTLAQPVYHAWQGPAWVVAVGCTTLKGSRCEWLVEKSTELGAHGLIPFTTERSQVRAVVGGFHAIKLNLQRVILLMRSVIT